MNEINRLRTRILNSGNAKEYRMSMDDARSLLIDIDTNLEIAGRKSIQFLPATPVATQHAIMDGGSFIHPKSHSPPDFS